MIPRYALHSFDRSLPTMLALFEGADSVLVACLGQQRVDDSRHEQTLISVGCSLFSTMITSPNLRYQSHFIDCVPKQPTKITAGECAPMPGFTAVVTLVQSEGFAPLLGYLLTAASIYFPRFIYCLVQARCRVTRGAAVDVMEVDG